MKHSSHNHNPLVIKHVLVHIHSFLISFLILGLIGSLVSIPFMLSIRPVVDFSPCGLVPLSRTVYDL